MPICVKTGRNPEDLFSRATAFIGFNCTEIYSKMGRIRVILLLKCMLCDREPQCSRVETFLIWDTSWSLMDFEASNHHRLSFIVYTCMPGV